MNKAIYLELDEVELTKEAKSSKVNEAKKEKYVPLRISSINLKYFIKVVHGTSR